MLLVSAAIVVAALSLPGIGEVRERLGSASRDWIVVTGVLALISMFGFARALWAAFDRRLPWRRAVVLGLAEQGANVLMPAGGLGGPALGVLVMRRAGVPTALAARRHAVLFLSTSAVNVVALTVAGALLSVGLLRRNVALAACLGPAALGLAVLLAATVIATRAQGGWSPRTRVGRLLRFVHEGTRDTYAVLRRGDRFLILGAVVYYGCDVAALAAAFHAVGGESPPLGVFVVAYTLGHAGALIPTPGGLGGTEGGLIGALSAYGARPEVAAAAVLGYRVFQLGLPALLGSLALLRLRRWIGPDWPGA
jgi:uncharacterized membrane protein YbhN (UPF0104 family)